LNGTSGSLAAAIRGVKKSFCEGRIRARKKGRRSFERRPAEGNADGFGGQMPPRMEGDSFKWAPPSMREFGRGTGEKTWSLLSGERPGAWGAGRVGGKGKGAVARPFGEKPVESF